MGELRNPKQERFAQEYLRRLNAGGKRSEAARGAYLAAGYGSAPPHDMDNSRRLRNTPQVAARIAELQSVGSRLVELDSGWALQQLLGLMRAAGSFNLDDFLGPVDAAGNRYYDLGRVSRAQMALLSEITIESHTIAGGEDAPDREVHKVKLKGPEKFAEQRQILALMARIGGWEAPIKNLNANVDLRDLIREAALPAEPRETLPAA